jgi:ComF family protein
MTVAPWCFRCGEHLPTESSSLICLHCRTHESAIARALAIGPHAGALRTIVHALKYDARRSLARPLAERMAVSGGELVRACDAVVPVPLHPAKRRSRGFNQAEDLAAHVGLPVVRALRRIRHTETQTGLDATARVANVSGAFRTVGNASALLGATVLLIDDVRTTGATLEACASTLRESGVKEVLALTAARVESPGS